MPEYASIFSLVKSRGAFVTTRIKTGLHHENLFATKSGFGWYLIVSESDWALYKDAYIQFIASGIIALLPKKQKVTVACSNPMPGQIVRKICTVGCIGCQMCVKACPKQAISMKGAVAVIDPAKCVNCGLCAQKCPAKAIVNERTTAKAV